MFSTGLHNNNNNNKTYKIKYYAVLFIAYDEVLMVNSV